MFITVPDIQLTDEDEDDLEFVEVGDANVETSFIRTASLLRHQKAEDSPSGRHSVAVSSTLIMLNWR